MRRYEIRRYEIRILTVLLSLAISLCLLAGCSSSTQPDGTTVRIAVPYEERLFGINEEYYKAWLEEQSGLAIEFIFIPRSYTDEYLRMLLSGQDGGVDAVFFSEDSAPAAQELAFYGAKGKIAPLEDLIDTQGIYLPEVFSQHGEYNLKLAMMEPDGHLYYMPALHSFASTENFQTLWINIGWLEELSLTIPSTTEAFEQVLRSFAEHYPDGAPLIGSAERENLFVCNFLMNSFAVCDPQNGYMAVENGQVIFSPATDAWREGLRYCHGLFEAGVLPMQNFTYSPEQLTSFCNDSRNLAGAFTAKRMSDILSEQSPQLLSRYLAVPPLTGPGGTGTAITETPLPRPGGVILASSPHQEELFRLLDIMCSKDAFLIGHYGQPGVDWDTSEVGDITIGGDPATITIKSTDGLRRDEDVSRVIGPFVARPEYADNVAWKGYQVNQSSYLEARAFRVYQPYVPAEYIRTILFSTEIETKEQRIQEASAYTKAWMIDFITGKENIDDDAVWTRYLSGFEPYDIEALIDSVQRSYDRMEE